jgi:methionyl-tRNA synthetase
VLTKNMPEQKDAEFTWKSYQADVNADLVGTLANFVQRVIVLTHKHAEGKLPAFDEDTPIVGTRGNDEASWHEVEMMDLFDRMWQVQDAISKYNFRDGLKAMLDIATAGNQLLQFNEPWKIYKTEPETVAVVLNLCVQYLAALSLAMFPFMPGASDRLRKLINIEPVTTNGEWVTTLDLLANGERLLPDGHQINEPEHLFSRVEDSWIAAQLEKLKAMEVSSAGPVSDTPTVVAAQKPSISYEDFAKLDIRTARILAAEAVPKADKLLKLTLEVNGTQRTVVSGIAQHYKPEDLPGKHIVILANLEPRKIRGVESEGMILMAEAQDGRLHFVQAASEESGMTVS